MPPKTVRLPRKLKFEPIILPDGTFNAELRAKMHGRSGVYILRKKGRKRPIYIGESHTGRAWKTMLRHLHAQRSFAEIGEWTYCCPTRMECAFIPTRARDAIRTEARAIARYQPSYNVRRALDAAGVPF
jgi:hypothetical protein